MRRFWGRRRLAPVGREIAEDAGRAPPAYDRAKARSRLSSILAEKRQAASKLTLVPSDGLRNSAGVPTPAFAFQLGEDGSTPDIAYQGWVHRAGLQQRTEQARNPRSLNAAACRFGYNSGDECRPRRAARRRMDLVDIYAFLKPNGGVIAGSTIVAVTLALVYAFTATPPSPPKAPMGVALDDAGKPLARAASVIPSDGLRNSAGVPTPAFALTAALAPSDGLRSPAGVPESADKAKTLSALGYAADQGHLAAQWKVGRMYAAGDGVPKDDQRAFIYFSQIANTHPNEPPGTAQARIVANAFVALGHYYLKGIPNTTVAPDAVRARDMFAYAASYFGDADAQYQLGRLYLDGSPSDPRQAARWFQLAATKGDCRAEAVLGDMLFQGQHVPRQAARGLMWLTLGRDCAGSDDNWIKPLYENAFRRANDDERAMALVFLENWLKGRRD